MKLSLIFASFLSFYLLHNAFCRGSSSLCIPRERGTSTFKEWFYSCFKSSCFFALPMMKIVAGKLELFLRTLQVICSVLSIYFVRPRTNVTQWTFQVKFFWINKKMTLNGVILLKYLEKKKTFPISLFLLLPKFFSVRPAPLRYTCTPPPRRIPVVASPAAPQSRPYMCLNSISEILIGS